MTEEQIQEGARLRAIAAGLRKATGAKTTWGAALAAAAGVGTGALIGARLGAIRTVGNPIGAGVGAALGGIGSAWTLYKNTKDEMKQNRLAFEQWDATLSATDREIIINEMNEGALVEDFANEWELIKEFVTEHTLAEQPEKSWDPDHWDHKAYHFRDKMKGLMVGAAGAIPGGLAMHAVGSPDGLKIGAAMAATGIGAGAVGYAASAAKSGIKGAYRFFKGKKTTSVRESEELRGLLDAAFDEKPNDVETHWNAVFQNKIADLVAERKAELAASLFSGDDDDEDEELEDEPSDAEEVADEAEVADDFDFGDIDLDDIDFDEEIPDVDDVSEAVLEEERKGSSKVIDHFLARKSAKLKNDHTDGQALYYHGNKIAWHGDNGEVHATHAGWNTVTTRLRLNTLANRVGSPKGFSQKKHQLHHGDTPIGSRDVVNLKEGEVIPFPGMKGSSSDKPKTTSTDNESFKDKVKRFRGALPKD